MCSSFVIANYVYSMDAPPPYQGVEPNMTPYPPPQANGSPAGNLKTHVVVLSSQNLITDVCYALKLEHML